MQKIKRICIADAKNIKKNLLCLANAKNKKKLGKSTTKINALFALAKQVFLISNANFLYFLHWQCKLGINFRVNFSLRFDEFSFFDFH